MSSNGNPTVNFNGNPTENSNEKPTEKKNYDKLKWKLTGLLATVNVSNTITSIILMSDKYKVTGIFLIIFSIIFIGLTGLAYTQPPELQMIHMGIISTIGFFMLIMFYSYMTHCKRKRSNAKKYIVVTFNLINIVLLLVYMFLMGSYPDKSVVERLYPKTQTQNTNQPQSKNSNANSAHIGGRKRNCKKGKRH